MLLFFSPFLSNVDLELLKVIKLCCHCCRQVMLLITVQPCLLMQMWVLPKIEFF